MGERLVRLIAVGMVLCIAGPASAGIIVAEALLVDLRAEDLPYGGVGGAWANHGTLDDFTVVGAPVVEDVDGRKCVTFDGSSYFVGPNSSAGLEGAGATSSIEVWVFNPEVPKEETMVSWSHRGGPDGTNMAFNYGFSPDFGAVGHWGDDADIGWSGSHSPNPEANNWWYLVYTHDGTTTRIYVNGEFEAEENQSLNTYGGTPIRVAAQADSTGNAVEARFNFTGSIADVRIHDGALSAADVANNFVSTPDDTVARAPDPADGLVDVPRDSILSWEPGSFAATHDVYLGTSFDDVNNADRADSLGVLVSQDHAVTDYAPAAAFEFGQTYYWRVDEVNAPPDSTIFAGETWSFTVEPLAYPIANVTATSNGEALTGTDPQNTANGAGLNENGEHSSDGMDMWLAAPVGAEPLYIQYEFDGVYKLHEMQVWNYNVLFEPVLGFGVKDVTVEYSENGTDWMTLGDVELAQATATADYTANTIVDFGGAGAKVVRLAINSNRGGLPQYGLSEVRFMFIPAQAREPQPADGATGVDPNPVLDWRVGRDATSHEVHLGTDEAAVAAGEALVDTVTEKGYAPDGLNFGTTYYWRIDEVQETESWAGDVWSFVVQEYAVIDDMESYNDEDNRIFDTWLDGFVNETGATVGYFQAPFAERTNINSGKQSMPLEYANDASPFYSEAQLDLGSMDLETNGADSLRLFVAGAVENTPDQLYVAVEDATGQVAVVTHPDAGIVAVTEWTEWVIAFGDLAGVDLGRVAVMYIGVGDRDDPTAGGTGTILVDDIGYGSSATE